MLSNTYKQHLDHVRGDEVAGRGFGYECLWRARLMLRLSSSDSLSIYQGEDALIDFSTPGGKQRSYYQIKHTIRQWTPKQLESFFERAGETLETDKHSSYVFCTNVTQTPALKAKFREINEKFGSPLKIPDHVERLRYDLWALDSEEPTDKIKNAIRLRLKTHFEPRNIGLVLADDDVANCCDRLLALEARFKLTSGSSVNGKDVSNGSGLQDLISRIPSLVLGNRLFTWESWLQYATNQNSDPTLSATRRVALESDAIGLDLEEQIFQAAEQWISSPTASHLFLVTGPSGVGKTWFLLRLGLRLSRLIPTYWGDELSAGRDPDLSSLSSWEARPTVLLVDNVIDAEWARSIPAALRSNPPILVIATSAQRHSRELSLLKERSGRKCLQFELGPLLSVNEISKLIDFLRGGVVTNDEQKRLESTTIRGAARILRNFSEEKDLTNDLLSLWRNDDCQCWVLPVIFCSSLGIKIPKSLLRDHARRTGDARTEFPANLRSFVIAAKHPDDDEEQIWLEEIDLGRRVLDAIQEEIGKSPLEQILVDQAKTFSQSIQPQSRLHRRFARRIVREFCDAYDGYREPFLASWKETIAAILPLESRRAIAYTWLSYIPELERSVEAERTIQKLIGSGPRSTADVILLIEAFGNEQAREMMEATLRKSKTWNTGPWASFIERLRPLDEQSQKELLALTMPLFQSAPLDFEQLFDTRNVATELISAIRQNGRAEHREWLRTMLNRLLTVPHTTKSLKRSYLINEYLKIVERLIVQGRSGICLVIIRDLLTGAPNQASLNNIYGTSYDLYKAAYRDEQRKSDHIGALERGLHYLIAEQSPTKAVYTWPTIIGFASKWASTGRFAEIEANGYQFLLNAMERGLPPRIFEALFLTLARDLVRRGGASLSKLRTLFLFFDNPPKTQSRFQLQILLAGAVLKAPSVQADRLLAMARALLYGLATQSQKDVGQWADSFLREFAGYVGLNQTRFLQAPKPPVLSNPIAVELLFCIGNLTWDNNERRHLAGALYRYYDIQHRLKKADEADPLRWRTILTLFRLEAKAESKAAIGALMKDEPSNPDALLLEASWEARFGDTETSEARIVEALRIYERTKVGGHLPQVRRAYRDLAARSASPKREVLELCAALVLDGPLPPLVTAPVAIMNESDLTGA
jgi:hypothetical protein